ncbi:ROK family protein [Microlunatus sp. GCM10028923]|uniref:ROK family protein n=1 Tax=Microlunatus sp. GCM10028923 TaxID=3273400 RepID=UPI003621E2F3
MAVTHDHARLRQLRRHHEHLVITELSRSGPLSRGELIRKTGLSRTTLFAIIADLVAAGTLVADVAPPSEGRGRGRPAQTVAINPTAGSYLGVDIGRAHVHMVILNAAHQNVAHGSTRFPTDARWPVRIRKALELVEGIATQQDVSLAGLRGIGLALQGLVEESKTARRPSPRDSAGLVTARFRQWRDAPIAVENNARTAALAEQTWGAARGVDDVLYIRCSDGVSGGLIAAGQLLRGAHGAAGEIGHVQVNPRGPDCYCGSRGCLELYIGIPALLRQCVTAGRPIDDAATLVELARAGDRVVQSVVMKAVRILGSVVASTATQFDPSRIIVAGELAKLGDLIMEPLRETVARTALPTAARGISVTRSTLGEDASALGAIAQLLRAEGGDIGMMSISAQHGAEWQA